MPHGKHVTDEECETMRDLYGRGYWATTIGAELDYAHDTVYYHVHGRCCHADADGPVRPQIL